MTLSRDQILAATDLPTDYQETPEWGGRVLVRAVPVGSVEFGRFVEARDKGGNLPSEREQQIRRWVAAVIMGTINEDGSRVFRWDDADSLREKHWNTVVAIATKAFELASRGAVGSVEEGKESSENLQDSEPSID